MAFGIAALKAYVAHRFDELEEKVNAISIQQSDLDAAIKGVADAVDALDAKVEALKASLANGVAVTQADLDALTAITQKAQTELNAP